MRLEDINAELKGVSFEFFYWFARFEYGLKENGFGKSSQDDWDNPDRNLFLLTRGIAVLHQLAETGDLEADYKRYY